LGGLTLVISGSVISVSGDIVQISGQAVYTYISGNIVTISGNVVQIYGYNKTMVSGAGVYNIKSGLCTLRYISINNGTSGYAFLILDSQSGTSSGITIANPTNTVSVPATTLFFDCVMQSGIVISTSGTGTNLTVIWN